MIHRAQGPLRGNRARSPAAERASCLGVAGDGVPAHRPDADAPWPATEFGAGPSLAGAVRARTPMDVARPGALLAAAPRRIRDK